MTLTFLGAARTVTGSKHLLEVDGHLELLWKIRVIGAEQVVELPFAQQDDLEIEADWRISGEHYWRTSEAWLANLDRQRDALLDVFAESQLARGLPGGKSAARASAAVALQRWRIFFLACAELFRYRGGSEWGVSHYRWTPRRTT